MSKYNILSSCTLKNAFVTLAQSHEHNENCAFCPRVIRLDYSRAVNLITFNGRVTAPLCQ